jgi:hypothetical protein
MNIQNDVIGLVLPENCKSKQVIGFIAWPSRCHGRIQTYIYFIVLLFYDLFTNVFFSWSLCLLNMLPSMVFPKHLYFYGLLT